MAMTASQRLISFLLRRLGTNHRNQESELWCPVPVCYGPGDGGSLTGPGEVSVNLDRGIADDFPMEQCNVYSVLEGLLGRCGVV